MISELSLFLLVFVPKGMFIFMHKFCLQFLVVKVGVIFITSALEKKVFKPCLKQVYNDINSMKYEEIMKI